MADEELIRFLRENPSNDLDVTLVEVLNHIAEGGTKAANYFLKFPSKQRSYSQERFLEVIEPENQGNGHRCHPEYHLSALAEEIHAELPVSQQLRVMKLALEVIAEVDPRVKGDNTTPVAQIATIRGKEYDMGFMRAFYTYVQHECHERRIR